MRKAQQKEYTELIGTPAKSAVSFVLLRLPPLFCFSSLRKSISLLPVFVTENNVFQDAENT